MGKPYKISMNLIVIRSKNIEKSLEFYKAIGLSFIKEKHGSGPEHYSSTINNLVFEIYPIIDNNKGNNNIRIGFNISSLDDVVNLLSKKGFEIVSEAKNSCWGRRAVMKDYDNYTVELIDKKTKKR